MDSRDEKPLFTRGRSLRFRPKSRAHTNSSSETESGMTFSIRHFRVPSPAHFHLGPMVLRLKVPMINTEKTIFHQN